MKSIEIYDDDAQALEKLAVVLGVELKALMGPIVNAAIGTYARAIAQKCGSSDEVADVHLALAYARIRGKVSCAQLQRAFSLSYNEAKKTLDELLLTNVIVPSSLSGSYVLKE